jgi:hypothetical protein
VEIIENTSWSCLHGIERWREDCGCHAGSHRGWHQQWRAPLREALDWLRDTLAKGYEKKMRSFLKNPWIARDEYIQIILHRSRENVEEFISRHAVRKLSESDQVQILKFLELQRHTLLMYTSCGWFFDELSGIETVQVMQYAGRAIQLGREFSGNDIEAEFLKRLEKAKSNIPEHRDGRNIFEKYIEPAMVDIKKVAAHYAISSLFEDYPDKATIFCYSVERKHYRSTQAGKTNLASGSAVITSEITRESAAFDFGGLHLGDHNLSCGVIEKQNNDFYQTLEQEIFEAYEKGDIPEVFRMLDQHFGNSLYSIRSLFRDEQRKILETVLEAAQAEALSAYRNLYEHHVPLIRFLKDSGTPPPRALYMAGELVLNSDLRRVFRHEELDHEAIKILIEDAELGGIALDADTLEYTLRKNLERQAVKLRSDPMKLVLLEKLLEGIELVYALPFDVNLRKIQNVHYDLGQRLYPELKRKTEQRGRHAGKWMERFEALSEKLLISFECD